MKHSDFDFTVLFFVIVIIIIVSYFIGTWYVSEIIDGIADAGFLILIIKSLIRRKYDK